MIHYSGHADFDEKNPSKSGWIFGKENVLSARDIFRARHVPRLIFANACFSGVVRVREALYAAGIESKSRGVGSSLF